MRKLILPIVAAGLAALTLTSLSPASAYHHPKPKTVVLTTKTVGGKFPDKAPVLGDVIILTEDAYRNGKKVGTSDIQCTFVRVDPATHASATQCVNTTVLPEGQIMTQGYVTSAQEENGFTQAIVGGTGAYARAHGELTVDDRGDGPATLTFDLR
jgi:hypothetical protein